MKINLKTLIQLSFKTKPLQSILVLILILGISVIPSVEITFLNQLVTLINQSVAYSEIIIILLLYIFFFYVLPQTLGTLQHIIKMSTSFYIDIKLKSAILEKAGALCIKDFEHGDRLNVFNRILNSDNDLQSIYENLISAVSSVISLLIICLNFGLPAVLVVAVNMIISLAIEKKKKQLIYLNHDYSRQKEEENRYNDILKRILFERKNISELFFYNNKNYIYKKWDKGFDKLNQDNIKHSYQNAKKTNVINILKESRILMSLILVLILFINLYMTAELTISFLYAIITIAVLVDSSLGYISFIISNKVKIDEYNFFIDLEVEKDLKSYDLSGVPIRIEFKNVYYKYPKSDEYVLQNVSFKVEAKEKVVLVGNNGSGKSTIIRLLLGYDRPESGHVLINGKEIESCLESLRKNTTVMFQDYYKYELTLMDNIIASNFDVGNNSELIKDTIKWSEIANVIKNAPNGLDTDIINGGIFSGGEWQKIAMARAKFKKSSLVILDEPNAAIDANYELKMYNKFISLFENVTVVVVSHRLPICQICDKIIFMDNGEAIEAGSHSDLKNKENGRYKELYALQAELYQ